MNACLPVLAWHQVQMQSWCSRMMHVPLVLIQILHSRMLTIGLCKHIFGCDRVKASSSIAILWELCKFHHSRHYADKPRSSMIRINLERYGLDSPMLILTLLTSNGETEPFCPWLNDITIWIESEFSIAWSRKRWLPFCWSNALSWLPKKSRILVWIIRGFSASLNAKRKYGEHECRASEWSVIQKCDYQIMGVMQRLNQPGTKCSEE
jgi:hypothetical protein